MILRILRILLLLILIVILPPPSPRCVDDRKGSKLPTSSAQLPGGGGGDGGGGRGRAAAPLDAEARRMVEALNVRGVVRETLVLAKGKGGGVLGGPFGPGTREALDVDDDAENAAPGNGSARGDVDSADQTEDVIARARARIAEARAQGRLDPDVSARATLIARGAGAPAPPAPAPAPRASSTSTSSRAETAGSTPSATTPPSNDA